MFLSLLIDGQDVYKQKMDTFFIYNFLNFMQWFSENKVKLYFVIEVYGKTDLHSDIQNVASKKEIHI